MKLLNRLALRCTVFLMLAGCATATPTPAMIINMSEDEILIRQPLGETNKTSYESVETVAQEGCAKSGRKPVRISSSDKVCPQGFGCYMTHLFECKSNKSK